MTQSRAASMSWPNSSQRAWIAYGSQQSPEAAILPRLLLAAVSTFSVPLACAASSGWQGAGACELFEDTWLREQLGLHVCREVLAENRRADATAAGQPGAAELPVKVHQRRRRGQEEEEKKEAEIRV